MKDIKSRSACPVSYTLDFLGDKWTLLILRDMILKGKNTYGEFLTADERIATNILADRLNALEMHGFITKEVASDKKSKYLYKLTEKGISLVPVLLEIALWGSQYTPPSVETSVIKSYNKDRKETIKNVEEKLRQRN